MVAHSFTTIYLLVIFANWTVELPKGNVGEARFDFIPQFTILMAALVRPTSSNIFQPVIMAG